MQRMNTFRRPSRSSFVARVAWGVSLLVTMSGIHIPVCRAEAPTPNHEREIPASVIFARVAPSTLVVQCARKDGQSQGSAVVIAQDQVATSYHVVEGASSINVRQNSESWPATLLAFDQQRDVAILQVANLDRPKVSLRPSSQVLVGERVFAVGAPRGLELSLSDGLVSALRTTKGELIPSSREPEKAAAGVPLPAPGPALIQTTAPVSPGSSGGGLFDSQGRLIGLMTFVANGQNLNFAHPSEWLTELRESKAGAKPAQARKTEPAFTIAARPPQLSCRPQTVATWGVFSGGAEMLESSSAKGAWYFERFNTQLPAYVDDTGASRSSDFVLSDMDRQNGFVRFSRATPGPRFELFFWTDDEGNFRVTSVEGFDFHGQLRLRTISGSCSRSGESGCRAGDAAVCMEEARRSLGSQKRGAAMELYNLACIHGDADGCFEAAAMHQAMGLNKRARELTERAEALRKKKAAAP